MVELALIMPVILVILLGVIALFGALGARQDLEAAVAQGARIGALEGNGGINCQTSGVVPMTDTVDADIISAITTTRGVLAGGITRIQIYQADLQGQPIGSKVNTYSNLRSPHPYRLDGHRVCATRAAAPTRSACACPIAIIPR